MPMQAGSLLVQRLRRVSAMQTEMDKQLFGNNMLDPAFAENHDGAGAPNRYLALHMRIEQDILAYSLSEFSGGKEERRELQAYRETYFPLLAMRLRNTYVRHCRAGLLAAASSSCIADLPAMAGDEHDQSTNGGMELLLELSPVISSTANVR